MNKPMHSQLYLVIWLSTILFLVHLGILAQTPEKGKFWKDQVTEHVLDPWSQNAVDLEFGAYHANLDRDWNTFGEDSKFPGMIARHLFSFSAGYLLSGKTEYIEQAGKTYQYLIEKGWDHEYGGWYYELDRSGKVINDDKELFMQTYAITGLTMYYLIKRNKDVKSLIDQSIDLLEKHAWDKDRGGYVNNLNRDWSMKDSGKTFSPQLAPLSGYLLYLYCTTRDLKYLEMSERIINAVIKNMYDKKSGWILESFSKDWASVKEENTWMNVGHNIEVAWMLMRLYQFNGNEQYRRIAIELNERLLDHALNKENGFWHRQLQVSDPDEKSTEGSWWVQAYGNMFQLYMFHLTGEDRFHQHFIKGVEFWNKYYMDQKNGGAFLSVDEKGKVINGKKAVKTKTSYHSVEHGLLNYLYLDFWINRETVELHFYPENQEKKEWYPLPVEDSTYILETSDPDLVPDQKNGAVKFPDGFKGPMVIRLKDK